MKRCKHVLVVAMAAAVLSGSLPGAESGPDVGICLRPAWGNWSICV
jgi:hypothetical protein